MKRLHLYLSDVQYANLVKVVSDRIERIEGTECNNVAVRLDLYAEMSALQVVLAQLGDQK